MPTEPDRLLTVDDIIKAPIAEPETLYVPEFGGAVKVIGLTKRQQLDIRKRATVNGEIDEEISQGLMWLEGVVEPRFSEEHIGPLFEQNAGAVDRVLKRVLELSGMKPGQVAATQAEFRQGPGIPPAVPVGAADVPDGGGIADRGEATSVSTRV